MNQTPGSAPKEPPARVMVGYSDIITHLDATPADEIRLSHAEAIATLFGAHLTGVYTNMLPQAIAYSPEAGAAAIVEMEQRLRQHGATKAKMLAERLTRLGVPSELRKIEGLPHLLRAAVAREARWADLFVASCSRETDDRQWGSMIESVLFESGHGVYLIPPGLRSRGTMRTILIGWSDVREAARAVAEAMPLLRIATAVHLVGVKEYTNEAAALATLSDIAAHLTRHGVITSINVAPASGKSVASVLLDQAHRVSADLIVTGAYGHSRVREWLLGGATRELLERSDIPLLMAH
jgi:nucleotide-binding universal stress UspA family protein